MDAWEHWVYLPPLAPPAGCLTALTLSGAVRCVGQLAACRLTVNDNNTWLAALACIHSCFQFTQACLTSADITAPL